MSSGPPKFTLWDSDKINRKLFELFGSWKNSENHITKSVESIEEALENALNSWKSDFGSTFEFSSAVQEFRAALGTLKAKQNETADNTPLPLDEELFKELEIKCLAVQKLFETNWKAMPMPNRE